MNAVVILNSKKLLFFNEKAKKHFGEKCLEVAGAINGDSELLLDKTLNLF